MTLVVKINEFDLNKVHVRMPKHVRLSLKQISCHMLLKNSK